MTADPSPLRGFQTRLGGRLLVWAALSMLAGGVTILCRPPAFLRDAAIQAVAWGAVDAAIALAALAGAGRGRRTQAEQAKRLGRVLLVNAGLDVLYVAAGVLLWALLPAGSGHGAGIVLQGFFLLVFDVYHSRRVPEVTA